MTKTEIKKHLIRFIDEKLNEANDTKNFLFKLNGIVGQIGQLTREEYNCDM